MKFLLQVIDQPSNYKFGKETGEWLWGGGGTLVVLATELTIILIFRCVTEAQGEALTLSKVTQIV